MIIKRKVFTYISIILIFSNVYPLSIDPFKGPKPIAVLIQTNPWLMVIGSDTPTVVIYDNGQIIFQRTKKNQYPLLLTKKVDLKELETIKNKINSFGDYSKLKKDYDLAPNVTDLPETKLFISLGHKNFVTKIYGLMTTGTSLPGYTISDGNQKPDKLPESILKLHSYLVSLDFLDAEPWTPSFVEVMIWNYDYAPDESIHWPNDWPGLDSPYTLKRGDSYSIFLPGKELSKLQKFLNTRKEKGAVEIDGKKWAISYRYTFPSEPVWFNAFR